MKKITKSTPILIIIFSIILAVSAGVYYKYMPTYSVPKLNPQDIVATPLLIPDSWPLELPYLKEAALLDSGQGFWLAGTPLSVAQATEFFLQDLKEYGWDTETVTSGKNTNIVGSLPTGELLGVDISSKSYKKAPDNWTYIKIIFIQPSFNDSSSLLKQT
jgi:hypothetical protein